MPKSVRLSAEQAWQVTEASHTGILTTLRRDGSPVALPVWFVVHEHRIYVSSPVRSKKVARVRADPRCSFLVESGERWAELTAVHWSGTATVITDESLPPLASAVRTAIAAKYDPYRTARSAMPTETVSFYQAQGDKVLICIDVAERFLSWRNSALGTA